MNEIDRKSRHRIVERRPTSEIIVQPVVIFRDRLEVNLDTRARVYRPTSRKRNRRPRIIHNIIFIAAVLQKLPVEPDAFRTGHDGLDRISRANPVRSLVAVGAIELDRPKCPPRPRHRRFDQSVIGIKLRRHSRNLFHEGSPEFGFFRNFQISHVGPEFVRFNRKIQLVQLAQPAVEGAVRGIVTTVAQRTADLQSRLQFPLQPQIKSLAELRPSARLRQQRKFLGAGNIHRRSFGRFCGFNPGPGIARQYEIKRWRLRRHLGTVSSLQPGRKRRILHIQSIIGPKCTTQPEHRIRIIQIIIDVADKN